MKTLLLLSAVGLALSAGTAHLLASGSSGSPPDYVAHEWGTFTSVVGSDGRAIPWNPFVQTDLPAFVYDRRAPLRGDRRPEARAALALQSVFGKGSQRWLQRMETPVLYFHADAPLTVSAEVRFPSGVISEWYPQVNAFGPSPLLPGLLPATNLSFIRWSDVRVGAPETSEKSEHSFAVETDPVAGRPSHYFHARRTAANPLVARSPLMTATEQETGQAEKFLFYRGAGNFETPLQVGFDSAHRLVLENTRWTIIKGLQVFQAGKTTARLHSVETLLPGQRVVLDLDAPEGTAARGPTTRLLRQGLRDSLTGAGLDGDEAEAMLSTWEHDWFHDDGLRVLYLLPPSWIDAALPLELTPQPRSVVRVMLGRAEILTPEVEARMQQALALAQTGATNAAAQVLRKLVEPRFLEPAFTRLDSMERTKLLHRLGLTLETAVNDERFKREETRRAATLGLLQNLAAGPGAEPASPLTASTKP